MEILDVFFKHKLRFLFVCRCWAGQCGWNGLRNGFFRDFFSLLFLLLFAKTVLHRALSSILYSLLRNFGIHSGVVLSFLSLTVKYIPNKVLSEIRCLSIVCPHFTAKDIFKNASMNTC